MRPTNYPHCYYSLLELQLTREGNNEQKIHSLLIWRKAKVGLTCFTTDRNMTPREKGEVVGIIVCFTYQSTKLSDNHRGPRGLTFPIRWSFSWELGPRANIALHSKPITGNRQSVISPPPLPAPPVHSSRKSLQEASCFPASLPSGIWWICNSGCWLLSRAELVTTS